MELKDLLTEISIWKGKQRNGQISKDTINKELKNNGVNDVAVAPSEDKKIDYKEGKGEINLACIKNQDHRLNKSKLSFDDLSDRLLRINRKDKPRCNVCSTSQVTKQTSQAEIDTVVELEKIKEEILKHRNDINIDIRYGSNKEKSNILSTNSENPNAKRKRFLDYDITVGLSNDNNNPIKVKVNLDGPSHSAIVSPESSQLDNDIKRAIENFKGTEGNGDFLPFPARKKDEQGFKDNIEKIKKYIFLALETLDGVLRKHKYNKTFDKQPQEIQKAIENYVINKRNERIDKKRENDNIGGSINSFIQQLLQNSKNYKSRFKYYGGKYPNIIDYLQDDENKNRAKSFTDYKSEWDELKNIANDEEKVKEWIEYHQAKNPKRLWTSNSRGHYIFEDKN